MANGGGGAAGARVGAGGGSGAAALQAQGSNAINNLQPPIPMVYLRLSFIDADSAVRPFPANVPVTVLYGPDLSPPAGSQSYQTRANGDLRFPAWLATQCRTFTLQFKWAGQIPYFVCEGTSSPPSPQSVRYCAVAPGAADPPFLSVPAASPPPSSPPAPERYFSLPANWLMIEADWYDRGGGSRPFTLKGAFGGNGSYDPATGRVSQTVTPAADIGSAAAPVEFVLDPHWRRFQFQFFDRYYGNAGLNSPPVAGHGRRISVPPVWLEGFRADVNAAGATADTCSNWTIGNDPKDLQQCLPWIPSKNNTGAALPALTGAAMGLRFRTHQTLLSSIYSKSDTEREIQHLASSPPGPLAPGPDRLRYYDLPRIWKSKKYYTRNLPGSPPNDAKLFQNLTAADILQSELKVTDTGAPRQLVFCLDDIVLTGANLVQHSLAANQRVAVFHHKFANRRPDMAPGAKWPNLGAEGVHKPGATVNAQGYPYSNITMPALYYITDYPDWTRLVAAQGNLFDVFGSRTPDVLANDVVGARAAVRHVDATTMPNGVPPISAVLGTAGTIPARPNIFQSPFFSIQPFYEQRYLVTYGGTNPQAVAIYQNEWAGPSYPGNGAMGIGRVDLVLLRCCDWAGTNEVSVAFRYMKVTIDFINASNDNSGVAQANPLSASPPAGRMGWAQSLIDNCLARWNGHNTQNTARVWVVPRPSSPPPPALRTQIVTFFQFVQVAWAHFNIRSCAPTVGAVSMTSFMNGGTGDGQIRVNAAFHDGTNVGLDAWGAQHVSRGLPAAHEFGHGVSLPDEYDNNTPDSPNYRALNVMGSPYNLEDWGLMFWNWSIRARYLWYVTEWMRRLRGLQTVPFQLEHFDSGPPGGRRAVTYWVPHYPRANNRNFVTWPVSFNISTRTAPDISNFDSALYPLGGDKYSTAVLPTLCGGGAGIDGILMVLLRLQVDFTQIGGTALFKTQVRTQMFAAATAAIEPVLNFSRFARFRISTSALSPSFQRCLIHFRVCYTDQGVSAAALDAGAPHHMRILLTRAAVANPAMNTFNNTAPAAGAKFLQIDVPNDFATNAASLGARINACAALVFQFACTALGLSSAVAPAAGSFQTPASYVPIVRTVMDAAAPAPVVS